MDMYVAYASRLSTNGKSHISIYLRESCCDGAHVRKRNIANSSSIAISGKSLLSSWPSTPRKDLAALGSLDKIPPPGSLQESRLDRMPVYEVAQRLGIGKALGDHFGGQLALWQVLARVLKQGSRLSAVRLAEAHAACAVLGIARGFDENALYSNLK
jgi:hypothetical protein